MLQEHDEPILRHLEDIKVKYSDPGKPMSFELEFLFSENEFFANRSLTKVYVMRAEPDETDPLSFEGPEIIRCNGCKIDWKKGSIHFLCGEGNKALYILHFSPEIQHFRRASLS